MRQVLDFFKTKFGKQNVFLFLNFIFAILVFAIIILIIKKHSNFMKSFWFVSILTIGIILVRQIKIPEEQIHIFEYGILGWFAGRDLIIFKKRLIKTIVACLLVICIGICDELFQKILPYRVYDVRDIIFNGLGGVWGIGLYLLS